MRRGRREEESWGKTWRESEGESEEVSVFEREREWKLKKENEMKTLCDYLC